MQSKELLDICSKLLDDITVAKVYVQLSKERKKVDYTILMHQALNEIEQLVKDMVDTINQEKHV